MYMPSSCTEFAAAAHSKPMVSAIAAGCTASEHVGKVAVADLPGLTPPSLPTQECDRVDDELRMNIMRRGLSIAVTILSVLFAATLRAQDSPSPSEKEEEKADAAQVAITKDDINVILF